MSDLNKYDPKGEIIGGVVEAGATGSLAAFASNVTIATLTTTAAGTAVVVSLPGVIAVGAATAIGFSLGHRVVKGINYSLNNSGDNPDNDNPRTKPARA